MDWICTCKEKINNKRMNRNVSGNLEKESYIRILKPIKTLNSNSTIYNFLILVYDTCIYMYLVTCIIVGVNSL